MWNSGNGSMTYLSLFVDPTELAALTACRLVALNVCPGVRPIGIGEVVRRVIGKTNLMS